MFAGVPGAHGTNKEMGKSLDHQSNKSCSSLHRINCVYYTYTVCCVGRLTEMGSRGVSPAAPEGPRTDRHPRPAPPAHASRSRRLHSTAPPTRLPEDFLLPRPKESLQSCAGEHAQSVWVSIGCCEMLYGINTVLLSITACYK